VISRKPKYRSGKWRLEATVCLVAGTLSACQDPGACTADIRPAVEVEVRDAVGGEHLSVTPRGVARDGTFEDSLRVGSTTLSIPPLVVSMVGADERAGTYLVWLEAEGYQAWDTSGIQVFRDECHVQTVRFTAALDPAQ
jgi:hypothetical protein